MDNIKDLFRLSVCIATYNGEKYISKQLESILSQLAENDELIISDDSSSDRTIDIIQSFNDPRIKLLKDQTFHSPLFNFENALKESSGDIIVLSDQDDIWEGNKLEMIRKNFNGSLADIQLELYNGQCIDAQDEVIKENLFEHLQVREGLVRNIFKNSFIGCNIAFTRSLLELALPFPKDIPMHDQWLGCCAYLFGKVEFVDEKVFKYRLHSNNYTGKKTSLFQKIKWRIQLMKNLFTRYLYVKFSY